MIHRHVAGPGCRPVRRNTHTVELKYDAYNRLISKRVDDDGNGTFDRALKFVYDGFDAVLVYDDAASLTNRYLHGPELDQLFADEDALGQILWPLGDHQGTIRDVVRYDSATDMTSIANHLTYDSFGNITSQSNSADQPLFAFTGRYWDTDVQLAWHWMRWYEPASSMWLSPDPIGFASGDTNPYRYVGNNPLNLVDPYGLFGKEDDQAPGLEPGENVAPGFQPGGPSDVPSQLTGKWRVSVVADDTHAWIRYDNLATGQVHTAGRYQFGYGGRTDERGNQIVPPVSVPGVQWNRDKLKEEGYRKGLFESRSVVVTNPRIYVGDRFGYGWYGNNCSTYARDAWYYYSREWTYLPGPDRPAELQRWIRLRNNPMPPIDYEYPLY